LYLGGDEKSDRYFLDFGRKDRSVDACAKTLDL
jgi:hypothetical protein